MSDTDYGTFPVPAATNTERSKPIMAPKHPTVGTYLPRLVDEVAQEHGISREMAALSMIEVIRRECCPRVRLTMPLEDDPRLGRSVA